MSGKRNRRAGVEDRWTKTVRDEHGNTQTVPSAANGKGKRWRARYVDERGREHAKGFARKVDAQACLDKQTAALVSATPVAPRDANFTFSQWARAWLTAYAVNRESSVESARTHIRVIETTFGDMALADIRPSTVKTWLTAISETYAPSYVRAVYGPGCRRFSATLFTTGSCRVTSAAGRRHLRPRIGPRSGWQPPSRCGSWSTQCMNTCGLPCCWGLSQGCGWVRCADCGSLTSISCAVSCTPRCISSR
jgi:hypothetical protein